MAKERPAITIELDGSWELPEFGQFFRSYGQVYAFAYTVVSMERQQFASNPNRLYADLPWRGGFSSTLFFQYIANRVRKQHRLKVRAIRYASPGVIELAGLALAAGVVYRVVRKLCDSADRLLGLHNAILEGIHKRKLNELIVREREAEVRLKESDVAFVETARAVLLTEMGFSEDDREAIAKLSDYDSWKQLKTVMAVYRRAKPIADLQAQGRLKLKPPAESGTTDDDEEGDE
jgi:hypothetical protein